MSVATGTVRNGVNTEQMYGTLNLIKEQPELAKSSPCGQPLDRPRTTIPRSRPSTGRARRTRAAPRPSSSKQASRQSCSVRTQAEPGRVLLHALAACLTTSIVYVAAARKVPLTSVESILTGDLDARGAFGLDPEPRNGFERIDVSFRVTATRQRRAPRGRGARTAALGRVRHGHQRGARHDDRRDRLRRACRSSSQPIPRPATGS